jgi:hypothetical protein
MSGFKEPAATKRGESTTCAGTNKPPARFLMDEADSVKSMLHVTAFYGIGGTADVTLWRLCRIGLFLTLVVLAFAIATIGSSLSTNATQVPSPSSSIAY